MAEFQVVDTDDVPVSDLSDIDEVAPDVVRVGPGAFWVARPKVGHGHRYVGDDRGAVLAIGAPAVQDPGLDPHDIDDAEIDRGAE